MKSNLLISTTDSIENAVIERYFELVSTNVVVGTNFFSDFGAGLTDFFGGYSNTYQNKLQNIYNVALDKLSQRASLLGANAIVGLKIDFDEVSGKGKSMFMISAMGMAVTVKYKETPKNTTLPGVSTNVVSSEDLEKEVIKLQIKKSLDDNILPDTEQWIYLLNNPIDELFPQLLDMYIPISDDSIAQLSETKILLVTNFSEYLKIVDREVAVDALYSRLSENFDPIIKIILGNDFFSPKHVLYLIKNDCSKGVSCLPAKKEFYSTEDLEIMKEIADLLENLPDKGRHEMVKGLLGKSKEKYICPKGHTNDIDTEYCETYPCDLNIKGLKKYEVEKMEGYLVKVRSLSQLFSKKE